MTDDSDMKIIGSSAAEETELSRMIAYTEEARRNRLNGNTAKAKAIGADIVSAFSWTLVPEEIASLAEACSVKTDNANVLQQMNILGALAAEYCLNRHLPNAILSSVAVNELYDVLSRVAPALSRAVFVSSAFSC